MALRGNYKFIKQFGIPENCDKIRKEFASYRNFKSIKCFITGPPASGKSFLGEKYNNYLILEQPLHITYPI